MKIKMLRKWWWPPLIIVALVIGTFTLLDSYFGAIDRRVAERSQAITREVALNLKADIENNTKALQTLGEINIDDFNGNEKGYVETASILFKNYPNYYAINWIDSDGYIRRVYPFEQNKAALGKNPMKDRAREKIYERSRLHHTPIMGTKIHTYQGIDAVAISIPVYDHRGSHKGWINGLLDLETFLHRALDSRSESLAATLTWKSDPTSEFAVNGRPTSDITRLEFRLFDEDLILEVGSKNGTSGPAFSKAGVVAISLALDATIGMLLIFLKVSLDRVVALNRRLRLKNALVSSLAHDMGTPLTVLNIGLERLKIRPLEPGARERLFKSSQTLLRMLESVRLIHAMETGRLEVHVAPLSLCEAVTSALDQVSVLAREKSITIISEVSPAVPPILAEASTLSQNVIPNLLTNAIKFSPSHSEVRLRSSISPQHVQLIIEDRGFGIPPEKLRQVLGKGPSGSDEGTEGEKGYGLGMIQVRTFMDVYSGSLAIESKVGAPDHGTRVTLTFRRANGGT